MHFLLITLLIFAAPVVCIANSGVPLSQTTVEELRITKAQKELPQVFKPLNARVSEFSSQVAKASNLTTLTQLVIRHGKALWQDAVVSFKNSNNYDDRSLYWARLQMTEKLRNAAAFQELLIMQQQQLLWKFELLSRGQQDVVFDRASDKKILITGFDPFFLDRNISQSNPSGAAALALDDLIVRHMGESAEIESLLIPVRFADFDQGLIEEMLMPYFSQADMIVTISMGREQFDLERFPGLRRSAVAPDNLNAFSGASPDMPTVPKLKGIALQGPEFVEFSLPVLSMQKAKGLFSVNDNREVITTDGKLTAESLSSLTSKMSVAGSGGGYLSNEISYRAVILRNSYNPLLPVGHIHTPKIRGYDAKRSRVIVQQIKHMLTLSIVDI